MRLEQLRQYGLTVALGVTAGMMGGALGQSGAETMLPGLLILDLVPNFKTAAGTTLLTVVPPTTLLAVTAYWGRGQVQVDTASILFVSFFLAAFVGAKLTKSVSDRALEYASAAYFGLIACYFLWKARISRRD